jgi:hypothetical protein
MDNHTQNRTKAGNHDRAEVKERQTLLYLVSLIPSRNDEDKGREKSRLRKGEGKVSFPSSQAITSIKWEDKLQRHLGIHGKGKGIPKLARKPFRAEQRPNPRRKWLAMSGPPRIVG